MTPDEMLQVARAVITKQDVEDITRAAITDSKAPGCPAPIRAFVGSIVFPKDTSRVEDKRFKRVVFCTFSEYNEMNSLKSRVAELEAELAVLRAKLGAADAKTEC